MRRATSRQRPGLAYAPGGRCAAQPACAGGGAREGTRSGRRERMGGQGVGWAGFLTVWMASTSMPLTRSQSTASALAPNVTSAIAQPGLRARRRRAPKFKKGASPARSAGRRAAALRRAAPRADAARRGEPGRNPLQGARGASRRHGRRVARACVPPLPRAARRVPPRWRAHARSHGPLP